MDADPNILESLLEQSLECVCLQSGSNASVVRQDWAAMPYTLVGQSVDGPLWVQPEGRRGVTVPRGGGYILPEGTRYRLDARDRRPRVYHWGHYRLRALGELDLFRFVESPLRVAPKAGTRIGALNLALTSPQPTRPGAVIARVAERRRLCAEALALIVSASRPRPDALRTGAALARLAPVLRFMREEMARPILRDELARVAGLSPSRFHAVFVAATGQSPLQHLTRLRLRQAQELLLTSHRGVNDVGEAVGFRDPFHFSRTFKRFSGLSPRAYRAARRGVLVVSGERDSP